MKKKRVALILLLLAIVVVLCSCIPQPFVEQVIKVNGDTNVNPNETNSSVSNGDRDGTNDRVLYVSGAVQTDGYITIPQICDYKTLLSIVGITDYTVLPEDLTKLIDCNVDVYIANFTYDRVEYFSVNVNSEYIVARLSIDGVDSAIVNKLADYIEVNGAIANRNQLKLALGDDYADNYYKFYIGKLDYAQSS